MEISWKMKVSTALILINFLFPTGECTSKYLLDHTVSLLFVFVVQIKNEFSEGDLFKK